MSNLLTLKIPTVGQIKQVEPDDYILEGVLGQGCTFTTSYNEKQYDGVIEMDDNGTILIAFTQENPVLPSNTCLNIECATSEEIKEEQCPNNEATLTIDSKLAIIDDEGCHVGYTTTQAIADLIIRKVKEEPIWFGFCDVLPDEGVAEGSLLTTDRILTTSTGCDLKSVSSNDIKCP